ncbi:hypothetical protein AZOA_39670 [Azoarcus sp. Aa7]|nr:hypothetical protein [Azoarcus sp. Aa7]
MNSPVPLTEMLLPQRIIEQKTANEIEVYCSGRGKSSIHQSARNLSLNVSDDYGNRFLVELIQNAHDAHPNGTQDGQISIVFAPDECDFGCLYVANRGNGFAEQNFRALTNIALSSKPVNESIGNKGLGFRSVLQICQWPEIYSVSEKGANGEFDGYCFRFADRSDLAAMIGEPDAEALADEILQTMPCWYLPVYAADRPGRVMQFAEERYASVVRMPLDSDKARELVLEQFDALLEREHPLHLFLERITCIRLEREPGKVETLQRQVTERWDLGPRLTAQRVTVGKDDYLLAAYDPDQNIFRKRLESSIERKEVPESWRNWQGSAQIGIAVRLGNSVESGLMYCFLPLGEEGKAPFAGYINANFYTKMDRRAVNDGIGLNRYFIEIAAKLSCILIDFVIKKNFAEAPGAVVDLLCWSHPYSAVVKETLGGAGNALLSRPLLPTRQRQGGTRWSSATAALIWETSDESCFSAAAVSRIADAPILAESLSDVQRASLLKFFSSEGVNFRPNAATLASWVEGISEDLLGANATMERWAGFYDEIAHYFKSDGSALFGKRFLLSVNRELIASELSGSSTRRRRAADVYFAPVMAGDSEPPDTSGNNQLPLDELPSELQKGFALLHREIPWLNERGGYRPGRSFFLAEKLVREYDTSDVIRTLAGVTQSDVPLRIKEQALRWAFRFWSSGRSLAEKETRAAGLFVPTRGGWRSAESSMFGSGWATCTNAKRLETFVKSASSLSPELSAQLDCFLPSFADWVGKTGGEENWVRFLTAAGVRDHLQPVSSARIVRDAPPASLAYVLSHAVTELSEESRTIWNRALASRASKTQFSTRPYRSELTPWRMPGLSELGRLSDEVRKEYAIQLIKAIAGLQDSHLRFRIYRPGNPASGPVPQSWPTPLFTLMNETPWMPVVRGSTGLRFVRPRESWYFNAEDEAPPRFMELIAPTVSKFIDEAASERLRTQVGLRTLNDPRDVIPALSAYSEVARAGLNEPRDVRRFRELFDQIWSQVAPLDEGIETESIPVLVGDRIEAFQVEQGDGSSNDPITRLGYFIDTVDAAKQQLVSELRLPAFVFGQSVDEDTWAWLEGLAPGRFVRLSAERLDVMVDGIDFDHTVSSPLLSEIFGPWIVDFIVCVAEHKGGAFFQATQSVLGKVRHSAMNLRVHTGKRIQISMSGAVRDLPSAAHSAVVLWPPEGAVLIAQTAGVPLDMPTLSTFAGQLAVALGYPVLGSALDAALLRLSSQVPDYEFEPPTDDDIAAVLGIPVASVDQTRLYVRADLTAHLTVAALLAAVLGETEALEQLLALAAEDQPPEDAVHSRLLSIAQRLGTEVPTLLERLGRAFDPKELMEEFGLPLSDMNRAIRDHFPRFQPISHEMSHRRALKAYLTNNSAQYVEVLRAAYLSKFDAGESLKEYAKLRDELPDLEPDAAWFETYDDLPDSLLHEHVAAWLERAQVPQAPGGADLASLAECRQLNGKRLRDFWQRFGKVLAAWVRHGGQAVTPTLRNVWLDPNSTVAEYAARAHKDGWLDFRPLDDSAICRQLTLCGVWPADKPLSTELADWGISEDTVRESAEQIETEREIARQKRLKLNVNGAELSATKDNYMELVAAITEHFGEASGLADTSAANQKLAEAETPRPGGPGGGSATGSGNKRGPRSPDTGLSDDQRQAVGLIGELYAKEWIRRLYREKHGLELDDACWVSGYSNTVLGTDSGNDQLGYDLIVRLKSVTHYYEVKASIGNSHVFEMGPTEIASAHKYRADKDHRYRVLYVSNATDHAQMRITLLPNPFSKEGLRTLRAIGRGSVTYEFQYEN